MKHKYLVVYDYGMGGVWAVINARSKDEIIKKFHKLKVYDYGTRPIWMQDDEYNDIDNTMSFDIDNNTPEWLKDLS